jgi:hypothetical protein
VFTKQEERSSHSARNSSNRARLITEDLNRLGDILAEIEVLGGFLYFGLLLENHLIIAEFYKRMMST